MHICRQPGSDPTHLPWNHLIAYPEDDALVGCEEVHWRGLLRITGIVHLMIYKCMTCKFFLHKLAAYSLLVGLCHAMFKLKCIL